MVASLLVAAALSAGNAEFERESDLTAATIAIGRLTLETTEKGLATGVLERAMLDDPAAFRSRSEAESRCRELYAKELELQHRRKAEDIARRLGVADAAAPAAGWFAQVVERHFPKAFERERADACAKQADGIALKVKPAEADIESKSDDEARSWLTGRIANARGMCVFEENLRFISEKIVDPLLADARRERKRQQEYLMRTRCEAFAPTPLAQEIEANLRRNVAERKAKCDDPERAWEVFPRTLREALPVAVERRIVGQVAKSVDDVAFEIDAESVRMTIEREAPAHRRPEESEQRFRELYAARLTDGALAKAIEDVPAAEREEYAAYVREHSASPELARAVDTRLRRDILPKWRRARNEAAEAEAARIWPELADRTWHPDGELADRFAARSDFADAVKSWRDEPGLSALAKGRDALLAESDERADLAVMTAFELARSAIVAQNRILEEVHQPILAEAKSGAKANLADVIARLTEAVERQWRERRDQTLWRDGKRPENADEQHVGLFPSVRRQIELVARQILEEMKPPEPEPEPEKKPEEPPEEPPPEETPPEEKPEEEELCTISFELSGGEVKVSAKRGDKVIAERTTKATASGFEQAVSEVGAVVGRKVFGLK